MEKQAIQIIPYLAFHGDCEQALNTYLASTGEAHHAMEQLAQGGAILSPLKPHPAPDDAGCGAIVRDGFGITWIITCPNPKKE